MRYQRPRHPLLVHLFGHRQFDFEDALLGVLFGLILAVIVVTFGSAGSSTVGPQKPETCSGQSTMRELYGDAPLNC